MESGDISAKDLASADRNIATSLGILNQNSRVIREKPTSYHKVEGQDSLLEQLEALGVLSRPPEPVDAEVVEPEELPPSSES